MRPRRSISGQRNVLEAGSNNVITGNVVKGHDSSAITSGAIYTLTGSGNRIENNQLQVTRSPVISGTGSQSYSAALLKAGAVPMLAGRFYGAATTGLTLSGAAADSFRGGRITVGRSCTLTSIAVEVGTAGSAGSVLRLGIYLLNPDTLATTLLVDAGTVDATTTGVKTLAISQWVEAGMMISPGAASQGAPSTQPIIRLNNGNDPFFGDSTAATVSGNNIAGVQLAASGALPATPSLGVSSTVPRVMISAVA